MKTRLILSVAAAATALTILSGCVSSKKYKASQAELARVRNDSSKLAQQVSSLNGNVQDLQNKNSTLQRSLDDASSKYAAQQHTLDYYQHYFKDQQSALSQVGEDVKGALTQAGISNGDVQMMDNAVYVRLDEDEVFKTKSTTVTPGGKKVLDNLAGVIKSRDNINVFVGPGDSTGGTGGSGNMSAGNMPAMEGGNASGEPVHHKSAHHKTHAMAAGSSAAGTGANASPASPSSNATAQNGGTTAGAPTPRKVHHRYSSEGSMAIYNGGGPIRNRAWALKQARMVTVANHFLRNGVPKVNLSLQQPGSSSTPPDKNIRVIITPKMHDFNPPMSSSATSSLN